MKGNPSSVIYRYIRLDFVTINQVAVLGYIIIILGGVTMFVDIALKAVGIQFVYAAVVLLVDYIVHKTIVKDK